MPGIFALTSGLEIIQYDVDDIKVAINNLDGTFGPMVDVPSCDLFGSTLNMKNQTMRGDGHITALASAPESAQCQFRFGSFNSKVAAVILGSAESSSGASPNRKTEMEVGAGQDMPYFAIAARAPDGLGKGGATIIWLPCCKIMQNVELRIEYNQFLMPQVTGMAIGDPAIMKAGNVYPLLWKIKYYETAAAIAMPLS